MNAEAKHRIVWRLTYEVHEILLTGECQGTPLEAKKLTLHTDAINLADAKKKAAEVVEQFKQGTS